MCLADRLSQNGPLRKMLIAHSVGRNGAPLTSMKIGRRTKKVLRLCPSRNSSAPYARRRKSLLMAEWGGPPAQRKYLYLQCDCIDSIQGPTKGFSPESFIRRLGKSRFIYVARTTDFLLLPEMSADREKGRCAWQNCLGQYEFLTITIDKVSRAHKVLATINGGLETGWVCKHAICVARFIGRRLWNARYLCVHLANDPFITEWLRGHRHFFGDDWKTPHRMWLNHHVCVTGCGHYDYRSQLFRKGVVGWKQKS